MKKVNFRQTKAALVCLAVLGTSLLMTSAASAAKRTFQANMDPGQENTAPDLGAHNPTGKITVTFDDVTKELCGKIEYTDLTGNATGVHIHRAPPGNPEGDSAPSDKVEIPPTASPVNFNIKLSADFEKGLNDGELYSNIHTAANTKGELRSASPWIEDNALTAIPCGPPTVPGGGDAGADAGKSSSSSSSGSTSSGGTSSSSGESSSSGSSGNSSGDTNSSTSGSTSTGGKDAGATAAKKKDDGGCNTTEGETAPLSFAMVLGIGIAALTRSRRRNKKR